MIPITLSQIVLTPTVLKLLSRLYVDCVGSHASLLTEERYSAAGKWLLCIMEIED